MSTKLFNVKVPYVFKKIFQNENNPRILLSFLNSCIKGSSPIVKIFFKNYENKIELYNFSSITLLGECENSELLKINIDLVFQSNLIKKSLFHWSKLYSEEYLGSGKYSSIPRTICINIIDFNLLSEEGFHNKYLIKNSLTNNTLTDSLEIHFLELPKLKVIDELDLLSLWTAFINDPNSISVIKAQSHVKELCEARVELARLSHDPHEKESYQVKEDAMNERMNFFNEMLEKRLEEGIQKGAKEEKIKTAVTMLKKNLDISFIAEVTGLKEEEVISLQES